MTRAHLLLICEGTVQRAARIWVGGVFQAQCEASLHTLMKMGVVSFMHDRWVWQFSMDFCSREHTVCPLSGIKKRPLVGGFLNTSTIVISIGDTAGVLCREVVRRWEGPLSEVPLYMIISNSMSIHRTDSPL